MPEIRYVIKLSKEEREYLKEISNNSKNSAQKIKNSLIILAVDKGEHPTEFYTDECIANILDISRARIYRVKRDCLENSIDVALTGKIETRKHREPRLDGEKEAKLVALACSTAPDGQKRWTVRQLRDKLIELGVVDSISHSTVARCLKKEIKPWLEKEWVIPPEQNGSFAAQMERVLDVYERPYNPENPVVCVDEMPKQLIQEGRKGFTDDNGVHYYDSEYIRNGTTNIFMAVEPLAGKRFARVIDTKTKKDFAHFIKELLDQCYPNAKRQVR